MLRRLTLGFGAATLALSMAAGTALAGNPSPTGTGQPSTSCDDFQPGPAGFGTSGFATAEAVYANPEAQGGTSSGNWHVVSQYDVACYQVATH